MPRTADVWDTKLCALGASLNSYHFLRTLILLNFRFSWQLRDICTLPYIYSVRVSSGILVLEGKLSSGSGWGGGYFIKWDGMKSSLSTNMGIMKYNQNYGSYGLVQPAVWALSI